MPSYTVNIISIITVLYCVFMVLIRIVPMIQGWLEKRAEKRN